MERIVKILTEKNKTIATMESCTGGKIADAITNIPGSSEVIKFSAITYSNEYKIKMGVDINIIEKYTVYSMETANAMSKAISDFANSDFGIGITGQLKKIDPANQGRKEDLVYISIYDKNNENYNTVTVEVTKETRKENKEILLKIIIDMLLDII